jgi:POT family proton-dependent oligopeptide transporter
MSSMTPGVPQAATDPAYIASNARWDRSFFGHPRGLSTLFFTEMWERFSYYGIRAILILFMTASVATGGLGFPTSKAGSVYGLYTSLNLLMSLPGGWIADRIIGPRRAVLIGGIVIAAGNFLVAIPNMAGFYGGLALMIVGTGLLKPNMSTMVGSLYSESDVRRDAGFSIFYMGINVGAMMSPLVCGYVAQKNWHYGFLAAGIGMTLGTIQYVFGARYLGNAGLRVEGTRSDRVLFGRLTAGLAIIALLGVVAQVKGAISISAESLAKGFGVILAAIVVIFFVWLLTAKGFTPLERRRLWAILVLFLASALFWSAFEQAGSTLNLFAERNTDLHQWDAAVQALFSAVRWLVSWWGWLADSIPGDGRFVASYFQSINSIFIVALAPAFAWLWLKLARREPSTTSKFSWGLVLVGLGFAILIPVAGGKAVSPWWLTATYLLHTCGELCLSPVGLSATTRLAPARVAGLMMGVWFLSISVGDYIGGMLSSVYETFPLPALFSIVAGFSVVIGLLLLFLLRPMKRLTGGMN